MIRHIWLRALLGAALIGAGDAPALAGGSIPTDANLVTALDLSDSIMRHEQWLQFSGMAGAIESQTFLRTIAQGRHGRIGFLVFAWASSGASEVIVPWTAIGSKEDARQAGALLRAAAARDRFAAMAPSRPERRTDLSNGLQH